MLSPYSPQTSIRALRTTATPAVKEEYLLSVFETTQSASTEVKMYARLREAHPYHDFLEDTAEFLRFVPWTLAVAVLIAS